MSHKTLVKVAIAMAVVFCLIVIVYPRIYAPKSPNPIEVTPAGPVLNTPPANSPPGGQ